MKEKLLILDDERLILTSLEHLFEDDYTVFTTSDAETALALVRKHDMAVILCDERMPGLSGHEFLRQAREISKATRVMISGYADVAALTDAVNRGQIFAYIAKPWEPPQLMAQVAAAVVHFKLVQQMDQERGLLRALMENIPDLIYFKDRQCRFTQVNRAHARHLGVQDPADCIGKSNADFFGVEDTLRWCLSEEQIMKTGQPEVDCIEQFRNPQGRLSWWSTTQVPMFDRTGQVSGLAGISRDITALKNIEEMLRDQNERSRMILETARDAFIGMEPDGTITAWNPQAERTFGWTTAEIVGRRLCDTVIAPANRDAHAYGVEHFLATWRDSLLNGAIELVALHRDGHEFPVEAMVWPVRAGGVYSFNAFVRDISERRRGEEARKKEATLIQLLQSLTVAANRSSDILHTIHTCLNLICAHTGWQVGHAYLRLAHSSEDLTPAGWHAEDRNRFETFRDASDQRGFAPGSGLLGRVLASGKPEWMVDLSSEEPASDRILAAVQAGLRSGFGFPVLVEGGIVGVLEFFSLQTVQPDPELLTMMEHIGSQLGQVIIRQRAEQDLQHAKASAESANLAKSEFLTTMSHEMRTPMNAILGMADLLSESTLRQEQQDYVRIFQKAGSALLQLINDILDLSKVESGRYELESIGFDLRGVLNSIIEMTLSRAQDRGLQLTLGVLPGVPKGLIGDPNRVRQILLNLVGNALKFTEKGSVTLRVEPDPDGTPGWLRFNVIDTGIGIAPDKTKMIFDRFTQADSSTTRKYGGTGLGLAISKGLAELMGGRIGCISVMGEGSTFFFAAPFKLLGDTSAAENVQPAPAAIQTSAPPRPAVVSRILIVEDSEFNVILIKAYLKDSWFVLDVAENGKIALEKVVATRPHLVLMDLQMPVMDGFDATRAIRKWEAAIHSAPIPILALTAHAEGDGPGGSLDAGCSEHLTKPIKKATLLAAIARHLNGKILVTPPEDIEGLVPGYLQNVRRDMDRILAAVKVKDCATASRLGHQFKGSGEGYGFPEITRTGAAVESAAMNSNEDEIRSQILALAAYLDRVEIAV